MTSRRMDAILPAFLPAAAVIGRLKYAQKFAVVGLVLLIPLAFVTQAYVGLQRGQIAFSAKERSGVALIAPLISLMSRVVEARHLSVTPQADGDLDLTADIDRVDQSGHRLGGALRTSDDWRLARERIQVAERFRGPADARYRAFNAATEALIALITLAGDESNLTLDPDLDTYYLMDVLQFRLPVLLDTAGRGADRALLAASAPAGDDADVFIELGLAHGVLASTQAVMSRGMLTFSNKTADRAVRDTAMTQFRRVDAATAALGRDLTATIKHHRTGRAAAPVTAADRVRVEATELGAVTARSLDRLLSARIDRFATNARHVQLGTGLAAALAVYLFAGFYLSVSTPIRRIVATLRAVAAGDLSQRVAVSTHDELSFVARALNDTLAKTEFATARLAEQATHDTLTGLPNRALVLIRLQQALDGGALSGREMGVLFIDLDRFKAINDSQGHEAGDRVLCVVAARLAALAPPGVTVGRLAGDEFVVVIPAITSQAGTVELGERIIAALSTPIIVATAAGDREANVGASIGIAFAGGTGGSAPDSVLQDADVAMYRAKQRGYGRVEVFGDALRVAVEHQLAVQNELRHAIGTDQLRVHYQPIVDTSARRVLGFEALARWQHPVRGLLDAPEFIDVAEESGLVIPLGADVLEQACRQMAAWRATRAGFGDLHVTVNVSRSQFGHPSFVPMVAHVLESTGLEPGALSLEITETTLMADPESAGETLAAIRAMGVHLVIDDFGTGYSSLAYLRRFPVEALKIDQSFVAGLGHDQENEVIISMIVSLAQTLGLYLVAEGVETADQLGRLRELGVRTVQGYYFGPCTDADGTTTDLARYGQPAAPGGPAPSSVPTAGHPRDVR
jgi:diguanylate cyclase (GGDEF)-like protein